MAVFSKSTKMLSIFFFQFPAPLRNELPEEYVKWGMIIAVNLSFSGMIIAVSLTFSGFCSQLLKLRPKLRWSCLTWFEIRSSIYETFYMSLQKNMLFIAEGHQKMKTAARRLLFESFCFCTTCKFPQIVG